MITRRARSLASMGDLDLSSVASTLTGGQSDIVIGQLQTIKTELKVAIAASYIAGALALVAIIRRL